MGRYDQLLSNNTQKDPLPKNNTDPRPDIVQDHRLWLKILVNAKELFNESNLFEVLHGIRCGGGMLEETKRAFKLHPGNEEWADPHEWTRVKQKWLDPVKDDLLNLFRLSKIGQVTDQELPPGVFEEEAIETKERKQECLFKGGA